jgi:hypothetical protein
MPQNGNIYHVKGHQQITEKSPIQAILNKHVDKKANEAIFLSPIEITLPNSLQISGKNKLLFSVSEIIHYCWKQVSQSHWKLTYGPQIYDMIDWTFYQELCMAHRHQVSIVKLFNRLTPTRERLHRIKMNDSPLCPLCKTEIEDFVHPILCLSNPHNLKSQGPQILNKLKEYGKTRDLTENIFQTHIRQQPKVG